MSAMLSGDWSQRAPRTSPMMARLRMWKPRWTRNSRNGVFSKKLWDAFSPTSKRLNATPQRAPSLADEHRTFRKIITKNGKVRRVPMTLASCACLRELSLGIGRLEIARVRTWLPNNWPEYHTCWNCTQWKLVSDAVMHTLRFITF